MKRMLSVLGALALLVASVSAVGAQFDPAEPQEGCDFFDETQHNLCPPFQSYWNGNGGLEVFGFPISEAFDEINPDLGEERLTQYFERERLEFHPENAGTEYEILLGRLGAQILDLTGVNWYEFPKASPSDPHYTPETGHAIAPEFWGYWSTHGLDLGDEGISYRESVALFGFPISPMEEETNSSGDTVPTQWFERARFELHDGDMVLLGLLGNELVELMEGPPEPPPPPGEVVAEGLNNPRQVEIGLDGAVYVAEAGMGGDECTPPDPENPEAETLCFGPTGAVTRIEGGEQAQVVTGLTSTADPSGTFATGPHDFAFAEDGSIVVSMGLGAPANLRDALAAQIPSAAFLGTALGIDEAGAQAILADIAAWEFENNPDGMSDFDEGADSNPYGIAAGPDGTFVVTDAGGNTLLQIAPDGTITMLALFEPRMVPIPPEFQEPGGPTELPMAPVPTSVEQGPDGAWYVGELTGFPFPVGGANVYRVSPEGEITVYASGFTNIVDIAFDASGNLYVVEMAKNGLLAAETAGPDDVQAVTGALIMVAPDGTQTEVASEGLILPGGVAVGEDGTIYVSNFSVFPGQGQVLAIEGEEPPPPPPLEGEVIAEGLDAPRGIDVTVDGTVYVTATGFGGEDCVTLPPEEEGGDELVFCFGDTGNVYMIEPGGEATPVVPDSLTSLLTPFGDPTGAHDVVVGDDGVLRVIVGLGADPALRAEFGELSGQLGYLLELSSAGVVFGELDIAAWESEHNPDGGLVDSNPFAIAAAADGGHVVSDAGANALLHVNPEGVVSTLAVFPDRMVVGPDGTQMPMNAVPTGVTAGPDGAWYVGQLTGFPFPEGGANVYRVTPEGQVTVYAGGFTNIIDVSFDDEGNLYVLEMTAGGLGNANPEDPATLASRVTKVAPNGTQQVIIDVDGGLVFATGLTVGPDEALYVSNFGVMPGLGQVVRYDLTPEAAPEE